MHRARMFQKPFRTFAFAAAFATSVPGSTFASGWIAVCSPPDGQRSNFDPPQSRSGGATSSRERAFRRSSDSFSGVFPTFVYHGEGSRELSVYWGNTRPTVLPEFILGDAARPDVAIIIRVEPWRVEAIEIKIAETWLTSLYPYAGVAFATRHKNSALDPVSGSLDATVFEMRCNYTKLPN